MKKQLNSYEALFVGGAVVAAIPVIVAWQIFWTGITIHYMWAWFIFPTFGIVAPSIVVCAGIASFAGLLTKDYDPESKRKMKLAEQFALPVIRSVLMLGIWWLVIKIMM